MEPLDFLKIASDLQSSPEEAGIRTAVSRAYYAVFNYVRTYLAENNIMLPNRETHKYLWRGVKNSGVNGTRDVGQAIKDLLGDRHEADYEMGSTRWREETCEVLVDKARLAIEEFQKCEGQTLVDGIRNHLVNVEGISV